MKVCAHYSVGGSQWLERHDTMTEAVASMRKAHDAMGFETIPGVQASAVSLSPQCDDCTSNENHHDYPTTMYSIGVHGGLAKDWIH